MIFFLKKKQEPKDHTVVAGTRQAGRQRHAHSEKLRYHLLSSWRWLWLYPTGSDREGAAFPLASLAHGLMMWRLDPKKILRKPIKGILQVPLHLKTSKYLG